MRYILLQISTALFIPICFIICVTSLGLPFKTGVDRICIVGLNICFNAICYLILRLYNELKRHETKNNKNIDSNTTSRNLSTITWD